MKSSYRNIFKHNFVQPLYKPRCKVNSNNKAVTKRSVIKLDGPDISVKRKVVFDKNIITVVLANNIRKDISIPKEFLINNYVKNNSTQSKKIIKKTKKEVFRNLRMLNGVKETKVQENSVYSDTDSEVWLRIYPLPKRLQESYISVIFRCVFCILGLYSFMLIWTVIWVFIIHSFEGPYEQQISIDFEAQQNQLVIDLATELRLITPISPKWKDAIIKRIEDERQLTIQAVAKGAKLHPGEFWDLSGTFLFTVYVMTALGFGAPVPQTLWGRISALLYALFAVPVHLYLMLNISSCVIAHIEAGTSNFKEKLAEGKSFHGKSTLEIKPRGNSSTDSEVLQVKYSCFRRKIMRTLTVLSSCRCMPLITICYYVCGALAFGWSRSKQPLEVVMFPLEFTTSGGLELVAGYVRILYGLYVEGAIILIACLLSSLKRNISSAMNNRADKYKLFTGIDIK